MLASPSSMLDHPAVLRALYQTFHSTTIDHAEPLPAGLSTDLIYRITVKGSPYILRIMTRIDERMDPARIFACVRATAAQASLRPSAIAVRKMASPSSISSTRSHSRPREPSPSYPRFFANSTRWRRSPKRSTTSPRTTESFGDFANPTSFLCPRSKKSSPTTARSAPPTRASTLTMVSCHSDLKPENILYDGRRAWLTGWQAAFVNDRYFDLALAANFLVRTEADELTYLAHYFDETAQ